MNIQTRLNDFSSGRDIIHAPIRTMFFSLFRILRQRDKMYLRRAIFVRAPLKKVTTEILLSIEKIKQFRET